MALVGLRILMFAVTLFSNTVTSQPCRRLFMQGLDNTQLLPYAKLSGLYSLTNITFDGFSAYRHEIHQDQLFFYNSTLKILELSSRLLVAQTSGRRPTSNVQYPYSEVITGWRVYQPASKSYDSLSADYIRPQCMDGDPEFRSCSDSGRLTFNAELTFNADNGQTVNVTQYEQVYGQYSSYRPVYKASIPGHSSITVYLYHDDGNWRLGDDYTTSTSAFARVSDTALRPEFITGVWQVHYNGWRRHSNLKLRCTGIPTATSCSNVQCRNGGTCTTAGSENVLCSCLRGYRGRYCEQRVPSCQYFGNWTTDYGGFYYTEDSYEGSLTAWFCGQGSRPEFGYSVCQNRYRRHRATWSNRALCQSLTTTTQRIWRRTTQYRWERTTRYRYHSRTDRTDPFEDVNAWLTPVVIASVIFIQIFTPFIIYCVLVCCYGYNEMSNSFAEADETEDKATAHKYKTQLEELESRTPKPEKSVMTSELRRIQQQLEEEVDQLRATRRLRDREKRKTVKLCRLVSFYYYVSFWLWMIYLIIGLGIKIGHYGSLFGVIATIAVICVIVLPFVFLIENGFSAERQYIKNLSLLTSATERIESIRNTQPTVHMNAECYHYELRTRTVTYTDANGNTQSRLETYQEKVVSAFIVEPFLFTHWFDSSDITLTDIRKVGITKIKMELTVHFGDQTTAQDFAEKFQRFQDEYRFRDVYVDFAVSTAVQGFEKRLTVCVGNKPCWISSLWFWLATVLCLGWPYRIAFNRATGKTEYSVVKTIFTNIPYTPATPTDADYTPETPSKNTEENAVYNIKTNIQGTLDRLNGDLSADEGDMPIKCAATNQHMNVTLQEAHHSPQTAL